MSRSIFYALSAVILLYTLVTGSIFKLLGVLFVLSLILFVHELGHFLAAKFVGTPVEEFSIGMGSTSIYESQIGETKFVVRTLPIGAYVKMEDDFDSPERYGLKKLPGTVVILLAGSVFNILLAVFLTSGQMFLCGERPTSLRLETIACNKPAYAAGLRKGDIITDINGEIVRSTFQLLTAIRQSPEKTLVLKVLRDGKMEVCRLMPAATSVGGSAGFTGVPTFIEGPLRTYSLAEALVKGVTHTIKQVTFTARMALMLIKKLGQSGQMPKGVGGPLKVAQVAWSSNTFEQLLATTAGLSVSIGVFNLLPFPILDGGRVILAIIAAFLALALSTLKLSAERRLVSLQNFEMSVNVVGLLGLAALFVIASYNDLANLFC